MKKDKKTGRAGKGRRIGVYAPAQPWCVAFVKPDVCVPARWKTFVLGEWAYLGSQTLYDLRGRAHRLPVPVFMRIGKLAWRPEMGQSKKWKEMKK